jgi:uncharacterized protein
MNIQFLFINNVGRLRSGWRLLIFTVLFFLTLSLAAFAIAWVVFTFPRPHGLLAGIWGHVAQQSLVLVLAVGIGWLCARSLEGLPFRAMGWSPHEGWFRDLLIGSCAGLLSLSLAVAIASLGGGLGFGLNAAPASAVIKTVLGSLLAFLLFGASEEALFRGYPLQTMTRARLAWVSIVLTAALFGQAHLNNPNVIPGFTFVNTALAGVWLALAYLRTRSLWLPLGLHWSWNWMMGAVFGLPVSGISKITPAPLFKSFETGPHWLTGGNYGIEGGAACTVALIISTVWLWKTSMLKASPEMIELTDHEHAGGGGLRVLPREPADSPEQIRLSSDK